MDVTRSVYRQLLICVAEQYLGGTECFALLVSAVCHDVGHPGLNYPFMVEVSHELALKSNDRSPLEYMHGAKLFEIVGNPKTDIFFRFIEAILHTDMPHHVSMVKETQVLYGRNSEIFDATRELYYEDPNEFPTKEAVEHFRASQDTKRLIRNLFLHTGDVSNPMKPFKVCRIWPGKCWRSSSSRGTRRRSSASRCRC